MLTVGEIARRTGLTVRTLHHYDEIGLVTASDRTRAGYRLYSDDDVARLQKVVALRQMGFPLAEIAEMLADPDWSLPRVLRLRMENLEAEIEEQRRLHARLEALVQRAEADNGIDTDELLESVAEMRLVESYFTAEQLARLQHRAEEVGPAEIERAQNRWPELMAEARAEIDRGTAPTDPVALKLAREWRGLIEAFTGGDAAIRDSLSSMYQSEPQMRERVGLDEDLQRWIGEAMAALAAQPPLAEQPPRTE